jgi:hypothetical protein
MLDFTNPEAHAWFKSIVPAADDGPRRQRLDGWRSTRACLWTCGCPPARTASPRTTGTPELWAPVNREFADEWKACRRAARGGRRCQWRLRPVRTTTA